MMCFQNDLQYHPDMSPAEAARVWMMINECTDNGQAAINYVENGTMNVDYQETPHGITILLHNGTCIPIPYKYDGSAYNLLCN